MKASLYLNYTSRSLRRGGQRTILAIFCIAVGVMAIVALQSVGEMINKSLTSNVRDANGGDIAVSSYTPSIQQKDLAFLDDLKQKGTIIQYTPVLSVNGSIGQVTSITESFSVLVVDPAIYPIVTPPTFHEPASGSITGLLKNDGVIIDQAFADQHGKKVGDRFDIHLNTYAQRALVLHTYVVGVVADDGALKGRNGIVLLSQQDYQAVTPNVALTYGSIYVATADKAHTDQAVSALKQKFPLDTIQTTDDALKSVQAQVDLIKKFLEIAGLLALLIGGVGIVNTMQVLLSRRKTEIAMLKTVGYRRFDLYLLFGLEAGLLGIVGGMVGALAATGLSFLVLQLVANLFAINVPFILDPLILSSGVLIGLCTALIFGLLPIVQAANIRPLNVIRDLPGTQRAGSILLTIGLLFLLSVLFCVMAAIILNDVALSIGAVYGTFVFLGLLSLLFSLVVLILGVLPVPERFSLGYLALVTAATLLSVLLALVLPTFGILLLVASLMGFGVVVMPRSWKVNAKMALRNIGRQRARTTTTLLALFVGVFTIGLILVLGQNLSAQINDALAKTLSFNVLATASGNEATKLHDQLNTVSGLMNSQQRSYATVNPESVDGQPLGSILATASDQSSYGPNGVVLSRSVAALFLSSMEGFDVAHNQVPGNQLVRITSGRNLQASDAGTDNVLINNTVLNSEPFKGHVRIGSQITLLSLDGSTRKTVTVVGAYTYAGTSGTSGYILAPMGTIEALSPAHQVTSIFYLKIDADKVNAAVKQISKIAPDASVLNFADIGSYINQLLGNVMLVLTAIASLSLLAGIIIIANAVALAMLERRRELGILKSVGYTSRTLLSEVLIENGLVGGTGALLAMLLVTLATSLLGRLVFSSTFGVSWYIAICLIGGVALVAIVTAMLVAWGAVRVRPLEVLRYE